MESLHDPHAKCKQVLMLRNCFNVIKLFQCCNLGNWKALTQQSDVKNMIAMTCQNNESCLCPVGLNFELESIMSMFMSMSNDLLE